MTDSDDQGSDPGNSETDYATVDEVAAELARLSSSELHKIELQARILVRGTPMDAGDVINTVVERLLTRDEDHGRHWHRKESLQGCFFRTMKSIVRDYWRRQETPMIAISDCAAGHRADPDPEVQTIARKELFEVLKTLEDEDNTSEIALALAGGESPAEIRNRFGLTETGYDSALRRVRRRILKYKKSTGRA
jgi:DNA-directed RNA polymerase specialized sigma24 family protein